MQNGPAAWLLEQSKGYVIAFVLTGVTIGPLALLGVIDRQWLVLPGALGITSMFVIPLILGHQWVTRRRDAKQDDRR